MTSTQQETRDTMQQLCRGDYGIIFITEQAYAQVPEIIDAYKEQPIPAIIPIPGKDGSLGIGIQNVKKTSSELWAQIFCLTKTKFSIEPFPATPSGKRQGCFCSAAAIPLRKTDFKVGENIEPRQNCKGCRSADRCRKHA